MDQNRSFISIQEADEAILAELGARLARERLHRNLTQAELAEEAGISRSTVRRLEAGESTQLTNLIRVLRVLQLVANLEALAPLTPASPLEAIERGAPRRRASGTRRRGGEGRPWVWGEDR